MILRAKHYVLLLALSALGASACSEFGLERFAPPGIVKYEDLAKNQPPSPAIVERVEAVRAASDGGYPRLSDQPQVVPAGAPAEEREAEAVALRDARDALDAALVDDRAIAAGEREQGVVLPGDASAAERSLEEAAAALAEEVARADDAARRERGLPPRAPAEPEGKENPIDEPPGVQTPNNL
jgi:hypothetical protein